MTKKELLKIINHVVESDIEECKCVHCNLQLEGTYLQGLLTAYRN